MTQSVGSGSRTRRLGAAVTAVTLATVAAPSMAYAQSSSDSTLPSDAPTGNSSVDGLIGQLPEEIMVGGDGFGSEGLRDSGSGDVADGAQSVGQVLGSAAPLEMLGVTGGSAAASVASSGSLPGSVYANPTGSLGSGTIGLGSLAIPEYVFPILSVQFAGGFFTALGERQEAGELYPHELDFWHGVVEGSADGGAVLEDAAVDSGSELPGALAGSIDAVQIAALEDPYEANERRRAEAEAAAEAEARGETVGDDAADDETVGDEAAGDAAAGDESEAADAREETNDDDDDETGDSPAGGPAAAPAGTGGTGGAMPALTAAAARTAPEAAGPVPAAPATLAATGVETTAVAGLAAGSLLLGTLLLVAARRRG